jgi:hypothetical protein
MGAIEWLTRNVMGFSDLTSEELSAPMHFSLLWSCFEAEALQTSASASAIDRHVRDLARRGKLRPGEFAAAVDYFRDRYFRNGLFTARFQTLNLRPNDKPALVQDVLSGTNTDRVDCACALFVIVYRIRNNYFHGSKWAYELRDQLSNFRAANESLMKLMDMAR